MIRKALTIFSFIGLLLSIACLVASMFDVVLTDRPCKLFLSNAHLGIIGYHDDFTLAGTIVFGGRWWASFAPSFGNSAITVGGSTFRMWSLSIPLWMPIALFGFLFWRSFVPLYRCRKRKKLGLCIKCGYDLRGSKDRCPECNTEFESHD
ncbi:MAG: hypothetical protein IID41_01050 [Planctomycetes bacterium]|nr:hypothetical protein [Planctomycetota bacterium]